MTPSSPLELAGMGSRPDAPACPIDVAAKRRATARSGREKHNSLPRYFGIRLRKDHRPGRDISRRLPETCTSIHPRPDDAARVQVLLHDMYVWLLTGYAADAVIRAADVVEIALRVLAGSRSDTRVKRDTLTDSLPRGETTELLAEARWVCQLRISAEPLIGRILGDREEDASCAAEIAIHCALHAGLISESTAAACQRSAAWHASEPTSSALLRLDRARHRKVLDDLLALPPRVLVVLVHGEVDQGHDHFAEIMSRRLRTASMGRRREIVVRWPQPSRSLGTRLAILLDELAKALGVTLTPPADDPTTPDGARAWTPALAPLVDAIDTIRERLLVRHVLRWLRTGPGGDDALVDAYVRAIWAGLAVRPGQQIIVGFNLRRIERSGIPMSKTWRISRAEVAATHAIERVLDQHHTSHGCTCIPLPELSSVPAPDLVDWLRSEAGHKREAAEAEASQLISSTRGGRFDLVVQRLAALNLDHHRNSRR